MTACICTVTPGADCPCSDVEALKAENRTLHDVIADQAARIADLEEWARIDEVCDQIAARIGGRAADFFRRKLTFWARRAEAHARGES